MEKRPQIKAKGQKNDKARNKEDDKARDTKFQDRRDKRRDDGKRRSDRVRGVYAWIGIEEGVKEALKQARKWKGI